MTNRPIKTVLFSYLQLSNSGCEIIVRGTYAFLCRLFPEYTIRVIFPSYDVARDQEFLGDIPEIEVVPMLRRKQVARLALRKTGTFLRFWTPRFSSSHFRRAELFVSIGGDIYTMFDGDIPEDWIGYEQLSTRLGIPSLMFGANMDRFEVVEEGRRDVLLNHLRRFKAIGVRDRGTSDYLAGYGLSDNVHVFPDPVFSLRERFELSVGRVRRVGINISPITVREFGPGIIQQFAELVSYLASRNIAVDLVPHVHSSQNDPKLDDRHTLRLLYDALDARSRSNTTMHEGAMGFHSVSEVISSVDMVIASRMHCALNALTQGKAVCFLEYSAKARTMYEWLSTETPYSKYASRLHCCKTDQLDVSGLEAFIEQVDSSAIEFGDVHPVVDFGPYLASSSIWSASERVER